MPNLSFQPERTALVIIDLQNAVARIPTQPYPPSDVIAKSARIAEALIAKGGHVFPVRVSPGPDGKDAFRPETDETQARPPMPPDGAELVPEIAPFGKIVITKKQWGAFYGTELDLQLRRRGIDTIILCGIATNIGVESTARDAAERSYRLILVEDAMSGITAEDHAFAMTRIFPRLGKVRKTDEVLEALG